MISANVMGEREIAIINPDGSGYQTLTSAQRRNLRPSFSPDGRMIVFSSSRSAQEKLYAMAANGDRRHTLRLLWPGVQPWPSWSPEMPPMN
jgi:TolB protein